MKYIRIKNEGIIDAKALHLVGASTKRSDNTKIGQFGSGNKYALAYLLRNGYDLKVFAGKEEVEITTKAENFRENEFNVIYINGEKTSITTEMGKDWELWQSIREIYCNALDEGGCSLDFVQDINPMDNETHFYIDNKSEVMDFMMNFDNYFATNKKVLFECEHGRILEKSGDTANIYRKGIRCFETSNKSMFDYDLNEIEIDENRLVKYSWYVDERIWDIIFQCDNEEVIMSILHNSSQDRFIESCLSSVSEPNASGASKGFKKIVKTKKIAPKGMSGLLAPDEVNNFLIIPTKIFQSIRGIVGDANVGKKFKVNDDGTAYRIVAKNKLQTRTIKDSLYFLKEVGFDMDYDIKVAIFDNKKVMGAAVDGRILLSDVGLERGVNECVNTIIEEYIHLKHGVKDETRAFQTAAISELISYMKKINSFAI